MRTAVFTSLLFTIGNAECAAEVWTFHYEAEKGELTASVPFQPTPLDWHTLELPRYSPDPLDRNGTIKDTTVRVVGAFRTHRIVEARIRIEETYYTDLFILLCETQPSLYLPIYVQQYNRGTRNPELTSFSTTDDRCSIKILVRYSGTAASKTTDTINVTKDAKGGFELECNRNP